MNNLLLSCKLFDYVLDKGHKAFHTGKVNAGLMEINGNLDQLFGLTV